jgi:hypothetical protein
VAAIMTSVMTVKQDNDTITAFIHIAIAFLDTFQI